MVLRLLVPGGSGDRSLCTGRRRSRSSGHAAGCQERPREEDGASGGGAAATSGTSPPHLAHHGAAQRAAAAGQRHFEPGPGRGAYRGELGELFVGGGKVRDQSPSGTHLPVAAGARLSSWARRCHPEVWFIGSGR